MPQPKKHLKPLDYPVIQEDRAQGGNTTTAAERVNMTPEAFEEELQVNPRARLFWEWGRGRRERWLTQRLHDPEVKNKVSVLFELKCKHGWIDTPPPKVEESRVKVEVRLPAALSPEQYQKVLDVTPPRALMEAEGD